MNPITPDEVQRITQVFKDAVQAAVDAAASRIRELGHKPCLEGIEAVCVRKLHHVTMNMIADGVDSTCFLDPAAALALIECHRRFGRQLPDIAAANETATERTKAFRSN